MTRPCRALAVLLLLSLMFAPRASSAQPADPKPTAAADAVGRVHFQRGQRLSASGNYAGAYREFAAGYAATKRPLFLFNMGEAARANGDVAKARESYLEFLRVDPNSALAATARTRLAELDRVAGTSQSGTSQSGTSRTGTSQSGTAQSGTAQSGTSQSGTSPSGTSPSGTSRTGTSPTAAPTGAAPTGTAPSTSAVT
ncbi:MAG TPA: tetratricopeptide repeat protein, partial [Kofleriaceae bacterium]